MSDIEEIQEINSTTDVQNVEDDLDSPLSEIEKEESETTTSLTKRKATKENTSKPAVKNGTQIAYDVSEVNNVTDSLKLPLARIKKIIKEDREFNSASNEAYQLITKATELFLQQFATDCYNVAARGKRVNVNYKDCATTVTQEDKYEFLSDVVPEAMKIQKALQEQKKAMDM